MEYKVVIKKDGQTVVEVVDRGEHLCSSIYNVTQKLGTTLSDEEIGPECGPVHEITSE